MGAALPALQSQIDQKSQSDGAAAAHTERQHESQRGHGQTGGMDGPLLFPRRGQDQSQGEYHTDSGDSGKHVGVRKNGVYPRPGDQRFQLQIVRSYFGEKEEDKVTDIMSGYHINADQGGQRNKAFQNGCNPPPALHPLPGGNRQNDHGQAEGAQDLQKFIEGKFAGRCVQG